MQTREQVYAAKIYALVSKRRAQFAKHAEAKNKYGAMAHKLPVLIRTAGLAQVLEFVNTREKPDAGPDKQPNRDLLNDLEQAVRETGALTENQSLLARSREAPLTEYMLLTEHALAALLWFKRYAQSVLDVTADAVGDLSDDATTPGGLA
jgi:CRISPR-associated protein Cmr5